MADPTDPTQEQKSTEAAQKLAEIKQVILGLEQKIADLKQKGAEANASEIATETLKKQQLEQLADLYDQAAKAREDSIQSLQKELDSLQKKIDLETDDKKLKELKKDLRKIELEKQYEELRLLKEKKLIEDAEYQEKLKNIKKGLADLEEERGKLEKIKGVLNTITSGYSEQIRSIFTMDGALKEIGNVFRGILETQQNLVKETGRNLLGFESMARMFSMGTTGLAAMGVGVEELGKAYGGLYNNFSDFSELSGKVQSDLAQSSAKMENLGVASALTGKNINELSKGLRFTAEEANTKLNQIAGSAIKAGIAPAKAFQDLSAALPQLSANGKQAIDVFFALEKQSKSLGMEVGDLLGIVGQAFDTFEGAAEKAGKLNAILGGDYLNSVEMLNATESERVDIMKRAFAQSGQSFDNMDRFQQKSIAMALGFKSAAEASKFFSNSSAENALALENETKAQEELEKAQLAAAPVTKQLSAIFSQLAIVISPFVTLLGWVTTGLAALGPVGAVAITAFALLATNGFKITGIFGNIKNKIVGLFKSTEKAPEAGKNISQMLSEIGDAGMKSGKGLMQVGLAMLAFGAGVGLAAAGLALLVASFKGLTGGEAAAALGSIVVIMAGFAAAIFFLGKVSLPASAEIAPLALVLLAIGAAVFLAAYGMSMLVESFKGLGENAGAVATAITAIMLGMVGMGVVILLMMKTLPATTIAVVALGVALAGLALVIYLSGAIWADFAKNLSSAGAGLTGFGQGMQALAEMKVDNLKAINEVLKEMSAILEKMPKDIKVQVEGIYAYGLAAGAGMATGKAIQQPVQSSAASVVPAAVARQQNNVDSIAQAATPVAKGGIGAKASSETAGRTEVIIKIDDATQLRGYVLGPLASKILTGGN